MPSLTVPRAAGRTALAVALVGWLAACDQPPTQPADPPGVTPVAAAMGNLFPAADPSGIVATYSTSGALDLRNPFFRSLGTNGRSCATCHVVENGFGLSAEHAREVFAASGGADPLFVPVDGANCPTAAPGSGPDAHSLLIGHGVFRIGITLPAGREFTLAVAHDPYHCAETIDSTGVTVSVYRRPLPATNLGFLSAVMLDGRETVAPLDNPATYAANLRTDLTHQALDATLGHAQAAAAPSPAELAAIVDFESSLYTAQRSDAAAGELTAQGALGGPATLADQAYFPGINDALDGDPTGTAFDPAVFTIFRRWLTLTSSGRQTAARRSVARGEEIFNSHPLMITNVAGLNDALGLPIMAGTCSTCHDAPNVGDHSLSVPLDIGTSHALQYEQDPNIQAALAQLSAPDLPVYQVDCGGAVAYTTDPGRALITGHCADLDRIKGPILRGLAARAPYFHNGSAATLEQVVAFYNERFQMGLTAQEQADLVAFLKSL